MAADVTIFAALFAGLISFLSPCVLPLVPPYLSYLTGATIEQVANDKTASASRRARASAPDTRLTPRDNSAPRQLGAGLPARRRQDVGRLIRRRERGR